MNGEQQASQKQLQAARDEYQCCDIQINDDAKVAVADVGYWVQAWVWLDNGTGEDQ